MKKNFTLLLLIVIGICNTKITNAQSWSLTGNSGTLGNTNFIGTKDNKALVFRTNNIERMRLSNTGKFGIGITNPVAKLQVDGGTSVSLSSPGYLTLGNTASYNIGLDIDVIQARNNGTAAGLFLNYYGGDVSIGSHNSTTTPAIYVATDGRVGIGNNTVISGYALTVNASSAVPGSIYSSNNGNGDGIDAESFYGNGVFGYSTNGYGVYAYADNSNGLYSVTNNNIHYYAGFFDGDVYTSGVYLGSDQKLKQNIKDVTSAMDIINQLKPKQYQFRHDENYKLMKLPLGDHYGLIAQDVEKILPNLVKNSKFHIDRATPVKPADLKDSSGQIGKKTGETIDFKALNYTELIPIVIKGMQEQQKVNDKQEQRIEQLEKLIENLTGNSNISSSKLFLSDNSSTYLKQNIPNPFTQNTTINCNVPSSAKQAELIIYNNNSIHIKSFNLTNGLNNVTISAGALSSGEYVYSLVIDGKKIDSRKMVLTK